MPLRNRQENLKTATTNTDRSCFPQERDQLYIARQLDLQEHNIIRESILSGFKLCSANPAASQGKTVIDRDRQSPAKDFF